MKKRVQTLTPREAEVARCRTRGLLVKQIGSKLQISDNTVRNHLRSVFSKLGVQSSIQLAGRFPFLGA